MSKIKYPTPYELKEVLTNFANRSFVTQMCQSKGIFFINARHEDVAENLSRILSEPKSLEKLREMAYQNNSSHALSGFVIKSSENDFSLKGFYERTRDYGQTVTKGYKLGLLTKVSIGGKDSFKGSIEYTKKRPGRIEFLDEEMSFAEFYFTELENGEWQIEVDGRRSADGKEVINLISGIVPKATTNIQILEIDKLDKKDTITFFDKLAKEGLSKDWSFIDTKHLTLKRRKALEDDEEVDDEAEISESQLSGISQAILEGKNLRENPFVKQSEAGGYIFTAMTYQFDNKTKAESIQIKAEFKGSPKIFEVSIVSSDVFEGIEAKRIAQPLSSEDHLKIRSEFWNNAKVIFNELI